MKKFLAFILTIISIFSFTIFTSCGDTQTYVVACPDGAPSLVLYNMLKENTQLGGYNVTYKIVPASNIASVMASGEADIAVMPTNVGAKLYNKGVDIKINSVNLFGVLYMVGKTDITSLSDLIGKVVLNIGRGGTPDLTLKYILDKNDIPYEESETAVADKVALNYMSEASEVIGMLKLDRADYGVVGEPVASKAIKAISGKIVLNLQDSWESLSLTDYPQAGVFMNKRAYTNAKVLKALNEKLSGNTQAIYDEVDNVKTVLTNAGSSLQIDFTTDILTRCNLGHSLAKDSKTMLEKYYQEISEFDSTFIGGKLPDSGFYIE